MARAVLWECGVCGMRYDKQKVAEACEAQPEIKPLVRVGDFVTGMPAYGWYNGDVAWIRNPRVRTKNQGKRCPNGDGNCFDYCCNYEFLYVVTDVHFERDLGGYSYKNAEPIEHQYRYSVASGALLVEMPDHPRLGQPILGYTHDSGHHTPVLVKNPPPGLLIKSKELLGMKADTLI